MKYPEPQSEACACNCSTPAKQSPNVESLIAALYSEINHLKDQTARLSRMLQVPYQHTTRANPPTSFAQPDILIPEKEPSPPTDHSFTELYDISRLQRLSMLAHQAATDINEGRTRSTTSLLLPPNFALLGDFIIVDTKPRDGASHPRVELDRRAAAQATTPLAQQHAKTGAASLRPGPPTASPPILEKP